MRPTHVLISCFQLVNHNIPYSVLRTYIIPLQCTVTIYRSVVHQSTNHARISFSLFENTLDLIRHFFPTRPTRTLVDGIIYRQMDLLNATHELDGERAAPRGSALYNIDLKSVVESADE